MYELVSDNILAHKNGASFIYKIPTFNTALGTAKAKRAANNLIVDIIYKLETSGEIVIIPKREEINGFVNKYYKPQNKVQTRYVEELKTVLKTKNLQEYSTYLILNETEIKQSPTKIFSKNVFDSNLSNQRRKDLIALSQLYHHQLKSISEEILAIDADETIELCNYLNFNVNKVSDDFVFEYNPRSIKMYSEDNKGNVTIVNSIYAQISEFPKEYQTSIKVIEKLKQYNFPIDIVIKFDINTNNIKLEKSMRHLKKEFKDENRKYKRNTQDSEGLYEYAEKAEIARKAQKDMQKSTSAIYQMQFNIRLSTKSNNFEILSKRYEKIKKLFASYRITTISCLGKQNLMHENFQIGDLSFDENIHSFSNEFTQKLSLLSDNKIGMPELASSKVVSYEVGSDKPVLIDEYESLRGGTSKTQSTIAYVGSSGSGKSQLVNDHMMSNVIINNAKALVIDPKGDREDFFKGKQLIDSYSELKIGANLKYKGLMDLFDSDNIHESKLKILDYIKLLYELSLKKDEFELALAGEFLDEYYKQKEKHCMLGFIEYLNTNYKNTNINDKVDYVARTLYTILKAFENFPFSNLFYGSKTTKKISFNADLTIIILESIDDKENNNTMKKQLFNHVFLHVTTFVKDFLRAIPKNIPSEIVLEEVEYLNEQTSVGLESEIARLCRSYGTVFRYVLQNPSGINSGTKNNTGTWYIGKCENNEEFKIITNHFELDPSTVEFLKTSNNDEGLKKQHKFNFLLVDTNNRKARIKSEFLPMFGEMFNTHIEEKNEKNN